MVSTQVCFDFCSIAVIIRALRSRVKYLIVVRTMPNSSVEDELRRLGFVPKKPDAKKWQAALEARVPTEIAELLLGWQWPFDEEFRASDPGLRDADGPYVAVRGFYGSFDRDDKNFTSFGLANGYFMILDWERGSAHDPALLLRPWTGILREGNEPDIFFASFAAYLQKLELTPIIKLDPSSGVVDFNLLRMRKTPRWRTLREDMEKCCVDNLTAALKLPEDFKSDEPYQSILIDYFRRNLEHIAHHCAEVIASKPPISTLSCSFSVSYKPELQKAQERRVVVYHPEIGKAIPYELTDGDYAIEIEIPLATTPTERDYSRAIESMTRIIHVLSAFTRTNSRLSFLAFRLGSPEKEFWQSVARIPGLRSEVRNFLNEVNAYRAFWGMEHSFYYSAEESQIGQWALEAVLTHDGSFVTELASWVEFSNDEYEVDVQEMIERAIHQHGWSEATLRIAGKRLYHFVNRGSAKTLDSLLQFVSQNLTIEEFLDRYYVKPWLVSKGRWFFTQGSDIPNPPEIYKQLFGGDTERVKLYEARAAAATRAHFGFETKPPKRNPS